MVIQAFCNTHWEDVHSTLQAGVATALWSLSDLPVKIG